MPVGQGRVAVTRPRLRAIRTALTIREWAGDQASRRGPVPE